MQDNNMNAQADYDAEVASQPTPPSRLKEKGTDSAVPSIRRAFFYAIFVLLAMVATGVTVWFIMDSKIQPPAPETRQPDDASPSPTPSAPFFPVLAISESRPLSRCMGDCDEDDDCDPGLRCFQRSQNTKVPGCSGGLEDDSNTDYCIPVEEAYLVETNSFPLGICQGGKTIMYADITFCEFLSTDVWDLVCFHHTQIVIQMTIVVLA